MALVHELFDTPSYLKFHRIIWITATVTALDSENRGPNKKPINLLDKTIWFVILVPAQMCNMSMPR